MGTIRVRCLRAPVVNAHEGIRLWDVGDEADVLDSHFWRGQIEAGNLRLIEAVEIPLAEMTVAELIVIAEAESGLPAPRKPTKAGLIEMIEVVRAAAATVGPEAEGDEEAAEPEEAENVEP